MSKDRIPERPIFLPPGGGRRYDLGKMHAVFKADLEETREKCCISEWWLEPHTEGPGAHLHANNQDIFYVLEGTVSILLDKNWIDAVKGSFVFIPENTIHDFKNNGDSKCGLLNIFIPGGFERNMPAVVEWCKNNR